MTCSGSFGRCPKASIANPVLAALAVSGCAWLLVWWSVRRGIIRRTGT